MIQSRLWYQEVFDIRISKIFGKKCGPQGQIGAYMDLQEFFAENRKVAIAFSGGVDSAYLLYAALKCNADVKAYYVKTVFQPQFELDDALRMAEELHADIKVMEMDILMDNKVVSNPANRCYYCKRSIFEKIGEAAAEDGYTILLDGTNASDEVTDRPGMRALQELSVRSPLRECGLTKEEIRRLSKEAGLFTWDKPAYACLATRVPAGEVITEEKLVTTEYAESYLFSLGFRDFRIRMLGEVARIQVPEAQMAKLLQHRKSIVETLKRYYRGVVLDLEGR